MTLAAVDLNTLLTTVGMIAALIVALLKHLGKAAEAKKVTAMIEAIEELGSPVMKFAVRDKATKLGVGAQLHEDVQRLTRKELAGLELEEATSHEDDPCKHCGVAHDDVPVGPCKATQCYVAGCQQPKDPHCGDYCAMHGAGRE